MLEQLQVFMKDSQNLLIEKCVWARSVRSRMIGLLNHSHLPSNESLLLEPCNNVHTFFMKFPIDVVFLDKNNVVLKVCSLHPWRISPMVWKAKKVLELPLGKCRELKLQKGQELEFKNA